MAERLRDLIEVPEVKLVVELDDADKNPASIAASFILTREVEEGLRILLDRVNDKKGCGAFIKGNFGSGKSHFLSSEIWKLRNVFSQFVGFHSVQPNLRVASADNS